MIINTKEISGDFTIQEIDGLILVNPREIGIEVCMQHLDDEEIWQSDLIYDIQLYLEDIINEAFDNCEEVLRENNREIDILQ